MLETWEIFWSMLKIFTLPRFLVNWRRTLSQFHLLITFWATFFVYYRFWGLATVFRFALCASFLQLGPQYNLYCRQKKDMINGVLAFSFPAYCWRSRKNEMPVCGINPTKIDTNLILGFFLLIQATYSDKTVESLECPSRISNWNMLVRLRVINQFLSQALFFQASPRSFKNVLHFHKFFHL